MMTRGDVMDERTLLERLWDEALAYEVRRAIRIQRRKRRGWRS